MKNSNRLIKFLKRFFTILSTISKIVFVVYSIFIIVHICVGTGNFKSSFKYCIISTKGTVANSLNTNLNSVVELQQISNIDTKVKIVKSDVNELNILDTSFTGQLLGLVNELCKYLFAVLILKQLSLFFTFLCLSIKNNKYFSKDSYKSLKKIGFYTLGYFIVRTIIGLLNYWDISVKLINNELSGIYPIIQFPIITIAIIFVIAEIYKAGLVMQEEQELTV